MTEAERDDPEPALDIADTVEGDDTVHEPADGTDAPPEPGAGLGQEVEEPDPEGGA
jgi:hypothetical protein